jgi:poly(hydroxyalkanoate) granule-associated protein
MKMAAEKEAEAVVVEEQVVVEEEPGILDSLRRVLLASVGVVALTIEEMGELVDKLVERGEIAEQEGKKLISEIKEKRKKKTDEEIKEKRKKKTDEAEDVATTRMREMMDKMDIPTKSDIDELSKKVSALSKKVDDLKKSQG